MCEMQYHNCEQCGEEVPCYQRDSECRSLQGYRFVCDRCDYWDEELKREEERRSKWQQEQFIFWED